MKAKIFLISFMLTLTAHCGFGQETYPFLTVFKKDSVIISTVDQVKTGNVKIEIGRFYHQLADSLQSENDSLKALVGAQNVVIESKKERIDLYRDLTNSQQGLLIKKNTALDDCELKIIRIKRWGNVKVVAFIGLVIYAFTR